MVQDRHFQCMLFLTKSTRTLTLTHPSGRHSVSVVLKEKQKNICSLITQYDKVNDNITLRTFLGYTVVLCYQTIAISIIMMSIAKMLQILLSYEMIYIKSTLKLKSQTDLRQSLHMATLFRKRDTDQFIYNDEHIHSKNLV